jgi:hypothetical protein
MHLWLLKDVGVREIKDRGIRKKYEEVEVEM